MTNRLERIRQILTDKFAPLSLEIKDDSASHAGHSGAKPGGETHYTVAICAEAFANVSRVGRQREVLSALASEFETGLHALSIKASAPT